MTSWLLGLVETDAHPSDAEDGKLGKTGKRRVRGSGQKKPEDAIQASSGVLSVLQSLSVTARVFPSSNAAFIRSDMDGSLSSPKVVCRLLCTTASGLAAIPEECGRREPGRDIALSVCLRDG